MTKLTIRKPLERRSSKTVQKPTYVGKKCTNCTRYAVGFSLYRKSALSCRQCHDKEKRRQIDLFKNKMKDSTFNEKFTNHFENCKEGKCIYPFCHLIKGVKKKLRKKSRFDLNKISEELNKL